MINAGLLAKRGSAPLIKLTDRLLESWIYVTSPDNIYGYRMTLLRNGGISLDYGSVAAVPGEWYGTGTAISTIGDSYQVRFTLQAGNTPTLGTLNTWVTISSIVWSRVGWEQPILFQMEAVSWWRSATSLLRRSGPPPASGHLDTRRKLTRL